MRGSRKWLSGTRAWAAKLIFPIAGAVSLVWFLVRVLPKPSRAAYPCQQAAFPMASAFVIWLFGLGTASVLLSRLRLLEKLRSGRTISTGLTIVGVVCFSAYLGMCSENGGASDPDASPSRDTVSDTDADVDTDTDADSDGAVVSIAQSETDATSMTLAEIRQMVVEAVDQAGGLDFITDGMSVVLKPNLVALRTTGNMALPMEANGVTTDWRITFAVAELVREQNPSGQILVMEGSVQGTVEAFRQFGYTEANFGNTVDEFIPLEGNSCARPDTSRLVERTAPNGTSYWVDERFVNADVVISLPVLKTHMNAGVTGAIKNIGIGMTPSAMYTDGGNDCTRSFTIINHEDPAALSRWIRDIYSLNPADFSVMDGLRGLANGPEPSWNNGDYATDVKNMRLVMASSDAVAMDTIEALVMGCDPDQVPLLEMMSQAGLGTSNPEAITVVGKQVSEVRQPLGGSFACPG